MNSYQLNEVLSSEAMSEHYCLVLCSCPKGDTAIRLAEEIVSRQLAACVNILPGIISVYPWEGKIESDQEQLLLIKTQSDLFAQLEAFIKEHHPYELPEIITAPINHGSTEYLNWITQCINS